MRQLDHHCIDTFSLTSLKGTPFTAYMTVAYMYIQIMHVYFYHWKVLFEMKYDFIKKVACLSPVVYLTNKLDIN